jgi:hypothetical protein
LGQPGIGFEIDGNDIAIMVFAEFMNQPRFAHLPSAVQNERLAVAAIFPLEQTVEHFSLHRYHLRVMIALGITISQEKYV